MEPLKQENRIFNPPADFVKSAAIPGMDAYKKPVSYTHLTLPTTSRV